MRARVRARAKNARWANFSLGKVRSLSRPRCYAGRTDDWDSGPVPFSMLSAEACGGTPIRNQKRAEEQCQGQKNSSKEPFQRLILDSFAPS